MRKLSLLFACFFLMASAAHAQTPQPEYVPGELYLKFAQNTAPTKSLNPQKQSEEKQLYRWLGAENIASLERPLKTLPGVLHLQLSERADWQTVTEKLQNHQDQLAYFERVPRYRQHASPSDLNSRQWHFDFIRGSSALDFGEGKSSVVVAVVDDGVLTTHEDLKNQIWTNPGEIPNNGLDDDNNGFIDDVNGYDVSDQDGDPIPGGASEGASHGTHIAGIIGAQNNNGKGIASIGSGVQIMPVKASADSENNRSIGQPLQGIDYAIQAGADIINMSFGSYSQSQTTENLLQTAADNGVLLVASAGNDNVETPSYPASYSSVLSVASVDADGSKSSFSNFGPTIDIAAPGNPIYSTMGTGNSAYGNMSGTSMAGPMVVSVLAVMRAGDPQLDMAKARQCLSNSPLALNDPSDTLEGKMGAGIVNAESSVLCARREPLAGFQLGGNTLCLGQEQVIASTAQGDIDSIRWEAPKGSPSSATGDTFRVTFNNSGSAAIRQIAINEVGSDTFEVGNLQVLTPQATLSGQDTILQGQSSFLEVSFTGNPPYDFDLSNGDTTWRFSNVQQSPFFLDVQPDSTSTLNLANFQAGGCSGQVSGSAEVVVLPDTGYTAPASCNDTSQTLQWDLDLSTSKVSQSADIYPMLELNNGDLLLGYGTNFFAVDPSAHVFSFFRVKPGGEVVWKKGADVASSSQSHINTAKLSPGQQFAYFLGTATPSGENEPDLVVMKISTGDGTLQWAKQLDAGSNFRETGAGIQFAANGNLLLTINYSNGLDGGGLAVLDPSDGSLISGKRVFATNPDTYFGSIEGLNGNFLHYGQSNNFVAQFRNLLILESDGQGNIQNYRSYVSGETMTLRGMKKMPNNTYAAFGNIRDTANDISESFVARFDANLNISWIKKIRSDSFYVQINNMEARGNDLVLVADRPHPTSDISAAPIVFSIDSAGQVAWAQAITVEGNENASMTIKSVLPLADGRILSMIEYSEFFAGNNVAFTLHSPCGRTSCSLSRPDLQLLDVPPMTQNTFTPQTDNPPIPKDYGLSTQPGSGTTDTLCTPPQSGSEDPCDFTAEISFPREKFCVGDSLKLSVNSESETTHFWYRNGTFVGSDKTYTLKSASPGSINVRLVSRVGACTVEDTVIFEAAAFPDPLPTNFEACNGDTLRWAGDSSLSYHWEGPGVLCDTCPNLAIFPVADTTYQVSITNATGCSIQQSFSLAPTCCAASDTRTAGFQLSKEKLCGNEPLSITNTTTNRNDSLVYNWSFGSNASPQNFTGENPPDVQYSGTGSNVIELEVVDGELKNCFRDTVFLFRKPEFDLDTVVSCDGGNVDITQAKLEFHDFHWSPESCFEDPNRFNTTLLCPSSAEPLVLEITSQNTGCSTFDTLQVQQASPNQNLGIVGVPDTLRFGDTVQVSANGGQAWDWTPSDWFAASNQQSTGLSPTVRGTWFVSLDVTDSNGCALTREKMIVVEDIVTGKPKGQVQAELEVAPNPASNRLNIRWGKLKAQQLRLLTVEGRQVRQQEIGPQQGTATFDLRALPGGVYLLKLTTAHQTLIRKVVKE